MDLTPLIQNDLYEDYFNKVMKLHCEAISTRNKYSSVLDKAEIRFKIDTMDKFYLVIYLENLDSNGLDPFNRGEVPADFVFMEIDGLKVPSRIQLRIQLSQLYGLVQYHFDCHAEEKGNPIYDVVHLIERQFMHKRYRPSVPLGYTPSHPNPRDYSSSKYYLSL